MVSHIIDISNVLVIGCGGAGLRAAIEVKRNNLCVKVLGKRSKYDAHTVLAAGGINASFGNLDSEDSWQQHFADTYREGYEIGDSKLIEFMAKNATSHVNEIHSWGADFDKLENGKFNQRYFGAHTYRRTCYSGDYTGQSILNALLQKTNQLKIPIFDNQYVTDLLVRDNQCFGAMSFDTKTGERTVHLADAVILCTGGHTRIWKKSSSRKNENTGDGLFLALKVGCELIDMEMVQFHPTGMLFPQELEGTLVTEAVRGEGGKLFNGLGERFMEKYDCKRMELSTRDKVAMANYTEIVEGRATPNGGVFLDISHLDKDYIISKLPKIYRQFIEAQMLDISKEPMEVAPTAHYSMGGIYVNSENHSTNIKGLFAAGEVAGGLHGANRLGGNSLAEILIFGKVVGEEASLLSKSINFQIRSNEVIEMAHENIDKVVKKGSFLSIPLHHELRKIMWKYCGVVKDSQGIKKGLKLIDNLIEKSEDLDVRTQNKNFNDLISAFDLKASLITAKSTMLSALNREESRGAHNRSDFKKIDVKNISNIRTKLKDDKELEIYKTKFDNPNKELLEFLKKTNKITNLAGKLIE